MMEPGLMNWSKKTFCHFKMMARRQAGFENANNYVLLDAIVKEEKNSGMQEKGVDVAWINPRGCENDLCININNSFLWDKAVCGKRKVRYCRSWILQRVLEGEDLSPVAGGETCDLAALPRKHLEDPERCLISLMATLQCKHSCVWALGMSIVAEEN